MYLYALFLNDVLSYTILNDALSYTARFTLLYFCLLYDHKKVVPVHLDAYTCFISSTESCIWAQSIRIPNIREYIRYSDISIRIGIRIRFKNKIGIRLFISIIVYQ